MLAPQMAGASLNSATDPLIVQRNYAAGRSELWGLREGDARLCAAKVSLYKRASLLLHRELTNYKLSLCRIPIVRDVSRRSRESQTAKPLPAPKGVADTRKATPVHVQEDAHFTDRVTEVQHFNTAHAWRKRGIAITPVR